MTYPRFPDAALSRSREPTFHYNPDLFWDADPSHAKATIPPGPNNPVGLVWVDLSKEHYGIHGTPEPATIGKTQSHGCIRLTNWDVLARSEEHTSELPSLMRISYAAFCLKQKQH